MRYKKITLLREIGRVVDVARLYKAIGDAWYTYANTPEGKAHLANGGASFADLLRTAGFKVGSLVAQAKATAQQQIQTIEASNWQPAIEDELDALLEDIEAEEQLAELNQQEANQPTTIPAEQSITGQEITVEPEPRSFGEASLGVERPETGSDEAGTTPEPAPAAPLLSLIQQGKAKTQDFARFFRDNPSITEAQATELGIRPLTQRGNPTATYTQGRLIAANLTPRQFEDYLNGKLKGKALKQALSKPSASANFSIKAVNTEAQTALTFQSVKGTKAENIKENLKRLKDTKLHCINAPEIIATVNTRQRGKLVSPEARNKSLENGFSQDQHLALAARVDDLYKYAIPLGEYDDINSDANVKAIFRFACPVKVDNQIAFALLTLKRTEGDKLYSLELDEINQLGGTLDRLKHLLKEEPSTIPLRAAEDIVAELAAKVKEYFGENALPPITAEQAEAADLFTDGVLEAENAIVTKPDVNFSIKALHASPHNFRKFTTEKMGTGEGAQAYGWGLYFATNLIINKSYFNQFNYYVEGWKVGDKIVDTYDFKQMIKKAGIDISDIPLAYARFSRMDEGIAEMQSRIAKAKESKLLDKNNKLLVNNIDKAERVIRALRYLKENDIFATGSINYRVELNVDDSNLLMWDEPVSRELHVLAHKDIILGNYEEVKDAIASGPTLSGKKLYKEIAGVLGSKKAASEWLAAHGYKGIKYLDGNSRSAGEGSYNYVIFSGDDIKITAVNESGVWSMDEGWVEYTDPTATFSIKPAAADTLDRFTADPLGERIHHHIRTEARRYARLLGDKTPYEQAVNAAQSAASIIGAVDKFLHTPGKPVPARYRRQLQKLRSIAEKYAQIIASGTPRSFKKISPQEQKELEAASAELEAQELETATTESDQLLTDSDRLTKREAAARTREHHRAIVRSAAKGRVFQTLSSMLEVTADALDSYLKHQLLQKLDRLTATVKIKRSPSKRLQGKMTAPAYRELERAINLMALSDRAYQDEIENVITAHETLARAINQGNTNLTSGNALLIQLADQLTTSGQQAPPRPSPPPLPTTKPPSKSTATSTAKPTNKPASWPCELCPANGITFLAGSWYSARIAL